MTALHARALGLAVPSRTLVRALDLSIEPGRLAIALGPNGAGKSTLLRALAGLRDPDSGRVDLDARPLGDIDRRERARAIAYLPQGALVAQDLAVVDLVMLGRTPHLSRLRAPTDADREAVARALARVELTELAHRRLSTLSGGERQRAMIARLLVGDARVLVLDEPTAALDVGHAFELLELLRTLAHDGRAVVIALHDLELARRYADVALLLHGDGPVDVGPADRVIDPDAIGRLFGVDARLGDDGLVLRARERADSRPDAVALARAAGPIAPGSFRVVVIEADARTTTHDFANLADARQYADDAASETEHGIVLAWVVDDRVQPVHRGRHYGDPRD